MKGYDVFLPLKTVNHKLHGDLQSLSIPAHWWKKLLIDFVTGLLLSANWKSNNYDTILVIADCLTKMVYYKSVKITIDALGLAEVIIDMMVQYHDLPNCIISDCRTIFMSKFWS